MQEDYYTHFTDEETEVQTSELIFFNGTQLAHGKVTAKRWV